MPYFLTLWDQLDSMQKIPVRHIISAQMEPDFSGSFSIRDIHSLLNGKNMVQELHRHDFYYVLILQKGAGDHEIDFTVYKNSDHTVFFMRPGQVHQLMLKAGSTGYLMQFRDDFYFPHDMASTQLLRKASKTDYYQLNAEKFKKLHTTLTEIFQEYNHKQQGYRDVIKANMGIFFISLVREDKGVASGSSALFLQEKLEEFLSLLELHFVNQKQVSQYAAMMNLSTYQLNAITRGTMGKSCSEMIIEHIVLEAKRYLLATSNQINQIADQLGYEDVSYFTRFFKKHTGYSPDAFRNNFR